MSGTGFKKCYICESIIPDDKIYRIPYRLNYRNGKPVMHHRNICRHCLEEEDAGFLLAKIEEVLKDSKKIYKQNKNELLKLSEEKEDL